MGHTSAGETPLRVEYGGFDFALREPTIRNVLAINCRIIRGQIN